MCACTSAFVAGLLLSATFFRLQVRRLQEEREDHMRRKRPERRSQSRLRSVKSAKTAAPTDVADAVAVAPSDTIHAARLASFPHDIPVSSHVKMGYLDRFLKWDCSPTLLGMGIFPNAKEITESMACYSAADERLGFKFADPGTLCVVVGDGATPRTAALFATRTKWRRIVSVDPALAGLPVTGGNSLAKCEKSGLAALKNSGGQRSRMHTRLARIGEIQRLELLPQPVDQVVLDIDPIHDKQILLVLPHAHVVPDTALGSLRLPEKAAIPWNALPRISVVQLPCCSFAKHRQICGRDPDEEYIDERICGFANTVRVWHDIAEPAVALRAVRVGNDRLLTEKRLSQRVRSDILRQSAALRGEQLEPAALPKRPSSQCVDGGARQLTVLSEPALKSVASGPVD